ncbi:hypothetical protein [Sorangium sp. So ce385]|uniref:hypothetical protein n=1 Tax=Sorangium sp. So ce385 TaxID=3133308 RepID=UPI003F5BD138
MSLRLSSVVSVAGLVVACGSTAGRERSCPNEGVREVFGVEPSHSSERAVVILL